MARTMASINLVKRALALYNFPDFEWVYSRPTVADLYKPGRRCGIYIFQSKNDEFYVGQAIDVTRRYIQHTKNHDDIQGFTFKCFPQQELNQVEQDIIKMLEQKKAKLRNISLTSFPKGDTDLDLIIPRIEQERWLSKNVVYELNQQIIKHPDLQLKYIKKFRKLIELKEFQQEAYPFLRDYFQMCVLQPEKTELSFWSLTCLVKAFTDTSEVAVCRLNLFWCEVMTIWVNKNGKVNYTFHLTKSVITESYLAGLKINSLIIIDHFYLKGGPDQFCIEVQGINDALKLLKQDKVITAIKTFNLRQMQKGATVFGRYHCPDLAKLVLDGPKD